MRASSMMWSSSSTTSTLELIGRAIASRDHHSITELCPEDDRNVNTGPKRSGSLLHSEASGGPLCGRSSLRRSWWSGTARLVASCLGSTALARVGAKHDPDRVSHQAEPISDLLLQVPPVGKVQQSDIVDEQHDGRRFGAGLGGIANLQALAFEARRRMLIKRVSEQPVELVGRNLDAPLPDHIKSDRQKRFDTLLRLRGDCDDRGERREFEVLEELFLPVRGLAQRGLDQVNLVDDDQQSLARFERIAGDVLVLGKHAG